MTKTAQWRGQMPLDLHTKLKTIAATQRKTLRQLIIELLQKGVEKEAQS